MQTSIDSPRLYLLGTPRLEYHGKAVEPDTRKAIALLAYLAVTAQAHSREALAALFYPENDARHARGALRRTLSALTRVLDGTVLEVSRDQVGLVDGAALWTDASEFQRLAGTVRAHHPDPRKVTACAECLARLEQAAALYRGDFMAGFSLRDSTAFDDWQFFQAESLRREAAGVLERLAQQYAFAHHWEQAITAARRWSALDPLVEDAHRELMRLYTLSGQRNAALRQYQECARILEKELGVEPLQETQQLYQEIQDNRLKGLQAVSAPNDPAGFPGGRVSALEQQGPPVDLKNQSIPLVGRGLETERLLRVYREQGPQGYWFALQGEAGIGKTRLAEDFLAFARAQGAHILTARCYEGETNLALAPFIEILQTALHEPAMAERLHALSDQWLAETARLLPGLTGPRSDSRPGSLAAGPQFSSAGQSFFYESLRQATMAVLGVNDAGNKPAVPAVLFIDDLHWADEASLDFLAYLVHRLAGHPLLVLLAWRDEELPAASRLRQLLAEANRQKRASSLTLERLSAAHVAELARLAADRSGRWQTGHSIRLDPGFAERLYRETEGLPFFLVAYLEVPQAAVPGGQQPTVDDGWSLPHSAQDLLRLRLASLDELSRQILDAGAIIGRSFDFNTLLAACGRSEMETITALEALLGRGLIRECGSCDLPGPVQYDFSHDKLRSLVYAELSQTRRRLLHRRVAEALADSARRAREVGPWAGQVALHYHQAGLEDEAAPYDLLASEYARRLYANREALAHLSAARIYYEPLAREPFDRSRLAWLHETCADLHTLLGEYAAAIEHYRLAREQILAAGRAEQAGTPASDPATSLIEFPRPEPVTLARLYHKPGTVFQRRGETAQAIASFQQGLEQLRTRADGSERDQPTGDLAGIPEAYAGPAARILADWSLAAYQDGQTQMGLDLAQKALVLASVSQQPSALAQAHNLLGILARRAGQPEQACHHLLESLDAARRMEDPVAQVAGLNNLALACGDLDDLPEAIRYSQQALELCERLGDRHHAAALHNNLSELCHRTGDQAQAMQHLKQAVVIFSEIGGQAGDLQPEIWKLTDW